MNSFKAFTRSVPGLIFTWLVTRYFLFQFITLKFYYPEGKWLKGDVELYQFWSLGLIQRIFPINDSMWQYPPLAGFVFTIPQYIFGNSNIGFIFTMIFFDFLILLTILKFGLSLYKRKIAVNLNGFAGAWFWVIWPILMGPLLLTRFDLVPTWFAILGLIAIYEKRIKLAGFLITVGSLLKLWPILILSILDRKILSKIVFPIVISSVLVLIFIEFISVGSFSFLENQTSRGLQVESVAAVIFVIFKLWGANVEYPFRFGSLEVEAVFANEIALILNLSTLIFFLIIFTLNIKEKLNSLNVFEKSLIVIIFAIGLSRVFSPQFWIWMGGISALVILFKDTKLRKVILILSTSALLTQILYPALYVGLLNGDLIPSLIQILRITLFIYAMVLSFKLLIQSGKKKANNG
ncbi:MAG: hypothetical protein ACKN9B_04675 [Actinomycetes bacterium]